jgi:hypothetical protein
LRKIYGPVKENEIWRIRQNDKLEAIIKRKNIVRFIKCQRIRWLGHVERIQDTAISKKMLYATRRRGRPKMRWLDEVSMEMRMMGVKRMEGQSKEPRSLEACCREGQGPPRAVAPFGRMEGKISKFWTPEC